MQTTTPMYNNPQSTSNNQSKVVQSNLNEQEYTVCVFIVFFGGKGDYDDDDDNDPGLAVM